MPPEPPDDEAVGVPTGPVPVPDGFGALGTSGVFETPPSVGGAVTGSVAAGEEVEASPIVIPEAAGAMLSVAPIVLEGGFCSAPSASSSSVGGCEPHATKNTVGTSQPNWERTQRCTLLT
jgi:hypothetical protein